MALKIINLLLCKLYAAPKSLVLPVAASENADYALAFKSITEFQNTIYGAAAFFVGRELWSWWKDSRNKTTERLDRIEKLVDKLWTIAEYEEKRQGKK